MEEKWEQILDSNYYVSNEGRVKNINTGNILKHFMYEKGNYKSFKIKLKIGSTRKTYSVHRLVAEAFIPNPENKPEVDHKDRNPLNNKSDNLRWATREENCKNRLMISKTVVEYIFKLFIEGKTVDEVYNVLK